MGLRVRRRLHRAAYWSWLRQGWGRSCVCEAARVGNYAKRNTKLLPGADVQLGEHLAQVIFDSARADEELGGDLRVRLPVARHPGDLRLLGRQGVACLLDASAGGFAGSE